MEKKIGVYICSGCGIGDVIDTEKLAGAAKEVKGPMGKVHPALCSPEGVGGIRKDVAEQGVNGLVIAACSPRAKTDVFSFDTMATVFDRVNLREQVAWSHDPKPAEGKKFDEDIQMMAEDQLRMGVVRVQNMDPPDPYKEEISKRLLVVGGGMTGMTSALEAARAGYEVVLVEREPFLGGFATKLYRQYPKKPPYRESESPGHESLIQKLRGEAKVKIF